MKNKKENYELDEKNLNNVSGGYQGKIFLENTETHESELYDLTGNPDLDSKFINVLHDAVDARNAPKKSWWKFWK